MQLAEWAEGIPSALTERLPDPSALSTRVKFRDSFYTAPGYREIGMFYSCVPDPAYPWDPDVMRRIWVVAPDTVPLWVHWVFMSPQDTGEPKLEIFGRHALGRCIKSSHTYLEPMRVLMPTMPCQGLHFEKPNAIWFIHQGEMGLHPKYKDLPGDYLPFDWALAAKVEDLSRDFRMTEKEFRESAAEEMITRVIETRARKKAQRLEEEAYAQAQLQPFLDRKAEETPAHVMDKWNAGVGRREREKQVFVDMGTTP